MSLFALIGIGLVSIGCFMNKKADCRKRIIKRREIVRLKSEISAMVRSGLTTAVTRRREINYTKRRYHQVDLVPPPLLSASRDPRRCAFLSVHNVYSRVVSLRHSVAQHLCSHRSAENAF